MTDSWFNFLNVTGRLKDVKVGGRIRSLRGWVKAEILHGEREEDDQEKRTDQC